MTTTPKDNSTEDLILGHFAGTLTEAQEQELANRLANSEQAKKLFGNYMRLEGRLVSLGRDGLLRENLSKDSAKLGSSVENISSPDLKSTNRQNSKYRYGLRVLGSLAATILLAAVIAWTVSPAPVSANSVFQQAKNAVAEIIDRTYRLTIISAEDNGSPSDKEFELSVQGGGKFLIQPANNTYVMGGDGSMYWLARPNGAIAATEDYRSLRPELQRKIPNRRLLDIVDSPNEPLLLDFNSLIKLIEKSYSIELEESENDDLHLLRAVCYQKYGAIPTINLWVNKQSGVFELIDLTLRDRRVRIELIGSQMHTSDWYHYETHFPDAQVIWLTPNTER